MTGSAYLGALLPVTSSWAVAPMAGQFALRGQSGAPRRLSAPVFLNGGGGEGVRAFSPLPWMGAMQSCTHRHVPAVLSRRLTLPARQGISKVLPRSCHAVPFSSARTAEYDHKSPRGYSDDITGPLRLQDRPELALQCPYRLAAFGRDVVKGQLPLAVGEQAVQRSVRYSHFSRVPRLRGNCLADPPRGLLGALTDFCQKAHRAA